MAEIDSYTALKQAITDYSETAGNPVVAKYADAFMRNVEGRLRKRLRISNQEYKASVITVEGQSVYTLPPKLLSLRVVKYRGIPAADGTPAKYHTLEYRQPASMVNMRTGFGGGPSFYTQVHQQLEVLGATATGGNIELVYYQGIPALTDSNPSNWVLADYPEVYLAGCMVEAGRLMKLDGAPQAQADWMTDFNTELDALVAADKRDRWSGPPSVSVPVQRW